MKRVSSKVLLEALRILEAIADFLAKQAILAGMRAWLAYLPWAAVAISVVVWLLEPKAIEKWCEKSVFRKNKADKGFKTESNELVELELAFKTMVES